MKTKRILTAVIVALAAAVAVTVLADTPAVPAVARPRRSSG